MNAHQRVSRDLKFSFEDLNQTIAREMPRNYSYLLESFKKYLNFKSCAIFETNLFHAC